MKISCSFARNVKKVLVPKLKVQEEPKKQEYEKKFIKNKEYMMASNHLNAIGLPEDIIKLARKVFSKYPIDELRDASYKYMRYYQLLHAMEKPLAITIKRNNLFENAENLQKLTESKVIHLMSPKTDEQELWKQIQEKRQNKNDQIDRLGSAEIKLDQFNQFRSLIDYDQTLVVSYLLRKVPGSYAVAMKILTELKKRNPNFQPKSYLDFGSGVSPWSWSVEQIFPDISTIACVEPNIFMRKMGSYLKKKFPFFESLSHTFEIADEFDLISMAYVLEEIAMPEARLLALQSLWSKLSENGVMILCCPGSPTGFRFINDFREWIIQQKGHILAPCPHQGQCPLVKDGFQWCHFDQQYYQWPKDVFPKHIQENRVVTEKYSYLVVSKAKMKQEGNAWPRVVFPPLRRGQHVIMDLCTSTEEFERNIVGKSAGIDGGYYEARHLRNGDLWRYPKTVPNRVVKKRRTNKIIKVI